MVHKYYLQLYLKSLTLQGAAENKLQTEYKKIEWLNPMWNMYLNRLDWQILYGIGIGFSDANLRTAVFSLFKFNFKQFVHTQVLWFNFCGLPCRSRCVALHEGWCLELVGASIWLFSTLRLNWWGRLSEDISDTPIAVRPCMADSPVSRVRQRLAFVNLNENQYLMATAFENAQWRKVKQV